MRVVGETMSINKIGPSQQMTVINKCCVLQCDKSADILIDGKLYCFEHAAEQKTKQEQNNNE